jgi:hypothetical protein
MAEDQMLGQGLPAPDSWQAIIRLQVCEKRVRDAGPIYLGKNLLGIGTMSNQAVAIHGDPLAWVIVATLLNPLHFNLPRIVAGDLAGSRNRRFRLGSHWEPQLGL